MLLTIVIFFIIKDLKNYVLAGFCSTNNETVLGTDHGFSIQCAGSTTVDTLLKNETAKLTIINYQKNFGNYCVEIKTEHGNTTLHVACFSPDQSSQEVTTTGFSSKAVIPNDNIVTTRTVTSDFGTTTTQTYSSSTASVSGSLRQNEDLSPEILGSVIGVGAVVMALLLVIVIVCVRRKNKTKRKQSEENSNRPNLYYNDNRALDDEDEMKENPMYHSRNNDNDVRAISDEGGAGYSEVGTNNDTFLHTTSDGQGRGYAEVGSINDHFTRAASDEGGGGYADVGLTYPDTQRSSAKQGSNNYSLPHKQTIQEQEQDDVAPVYAMPDKTKKNRQEEKDVGPVYALPDKTKKKNKVECADPVYAMPNKKNKNFSKEDETGPVYSLPDKKKTEKVEKRKKPAAPKTALKPKPKLDNLQQNSRPVNEAGLHYPDLSLQDSVDVTSTQAKNNANERTEYAEIS